MSFQEIFNSQVDAFKEAVEKHLEASEMTPTTFGQTVLGDPNFVFDLRKGRIPQADTMDKVIAHIRQKQSAPATEAAA